MSTPHDSLASLKMVVNDDGTVTFTAESRHAAKGLLIYAGCGAASIAGDCMRHMRMDAHDLAMKNEQKISLLYDELDGTISVGEAN
jgi:Uri superfamily endonuclease